MPGQNLAARSGPAPTAGPRLTVPAARRGQHMSWYGRCRVDADAVVLCKRPNCCVTRVTPHAAGLRVLVNLGAPAIGGAPDRGLTLPDSARRSVGQPTPAVRASTVFVRRFEPRPRAASGSPVPDVVFAQPLDAGRPPLSAGQWTLPATPGPLRCAAPTGAFSARLPPTCAVPDRPAAVSSPIRRRGHLSGLPFLG